YGAGVLRTLEGAGYDNAMVLDALRRLGEQATAAGRIVQRIRGFLTRRAPQRERCTVQELATRALQLLRRDLQHAGIDTSTDIAADPAPLDADPVLIEQVLINLVRNAMDELQATQRAAGRIRIAARPAGERFVRIDVDDNGRGLAGRPIQQLSAPFYSTKAD